MALIAEKKIRGAPFDMGRLKKDLNNFMAKNKAKSYLVYMNSEGSPCGYGVRNYLTLCAYDK